jgi:hypothetical protein
MAFAAIGFREHCFQESVRPHIVGLANKVLAQAGVSANQIRIRMKLTMCVKDDQRTVRHFRAARYRQNRKNPTSKGIRILELEPDTTARAERIFKARRAIIQDDRNQDRCIDRKSVV